MPRDQNEEADALTNGAFASFDPFRRVTIDPGKVQWQVLPRMLAVAGDLYSDAQRAKASAGPQKAEARRRPAGLRQTDPW